jgi:uncharacterized membrane protein required for colicin V production
MDIIERIIANPVLIAFLILMLVCILRGLHKGMLSIVFGMISWIFIIWFINFTFGEVSNYLHESTNIPVFVQESIAGNLTKKYEASETEKEGTGEDAMLKIVPASIKDKIDEGIHNTVESTISFISKELSDTAIRGISIIISMLVGALVVFLLRRLIFYIGRVPGIRGVNRTLGFAAGFLEGMLITWLIMYLADCFPTTDWGHYVLDNIAVDPLLTHVYQMNVITRIIGI